MNEQLVIGVDGGGSKTVAILSDIEGKLLGRGTAGPSNYQVVGVKESLSSLENAIFQAYQSAGIPFCLPAAMVMGISGIDREEDLSIIQDWAHLRFPGVNVLAVNDGQLVMMSALRERRGVVIICGTGCVVYGKDQSGRVARVSGWGPLLGDEGSGYWIGLQALQSVMQAYDGRIPPTMISDLLLDSLGLARPTDLIGFVESLTMPHHTIAGFSTLVEQAAVQGDQQAHAILDLAGYQLALSVQAAVRQLNLPAQVAYGMGGSILVKGKLVKEYLLHHLEGFGLNMNPIVMIEEPAIGATQMACELAKHAHLSISTQEE